MMWSAHRLAASGVGQVLGLIRGQELGDQHGPAVLGPGVPPRGGRAPARPVPGDPGTRRPRPRSRAARPAGPRAAGPLRAPPWPGGRQRPDPGPDERVVSRERFARRRSLPESVTASAVSSSRRACGASTWLKVAREDRPAVRGARRPAALEQPVDLGSDPAVPEHTARVVVHHHDQGMRFFAGVAVHADHFVAVAEHVGVHIALRRRHRAHMLGPPGRTTPRSISASAAVSACMAWRGVPRQAMPDSSASAAGLRCCAA